MALKSLIFASLLALALAQSESYPPATEPPTPEPEPEMPKSQCVTAGFMCSDCNNQAVCIGTGDGLTFQQIENRCPEGSHCIGNTCVEGAKCNYRAFACADEGFFPDTYDCKKYHVCVKDGTGSFQAMEMHCGDDNGSYDASAGSCGFPLNSTACLEGPVPRCTEPLQIGGLTSDPSIYYLCIDDGTTTAPSLYKCAGGKVFDAKKVSCVAAKKAKK